jgi:hypothetical protein
LMHEWSFSILKYLYFYFFYLPLFHIHSWALSQFYLFFTVICTSNIVKWERDTIKFYFTFLSCEFHNSNHSIIMLWNSACGSDMMVKCVVVFLNTHTWNKIVTIEYDNVKSGWMLWLHIPSFNFNLFNSAGRFVIHF